MPFFIDFLREDGTGMKKPLIGITPDYLEENQALSLKMAYVTAVEKAGGIPLVLPHTADGETAEALGALCDGFLFSGGVDLDPKFYGETPIPELGEVSPLRDGTDFLFFKIANRSEKPILGICRGAQILNVGRGGSLYQDLPAQWENGDLLSHCQTEPGTVKVHSVTAKAGSLIAKAYGTEFSVNSFHHQAAKRPGNGLTVTAQASDGVIEALEDKNRRFFVLTQWHPEKMYDVSEGSRKLFRLFIEACR